MKCVRLVKAGEADLAGAILLRQVDASSRLDIPGNPVFGTNPSVLPHIVEAILNHVSGLRAGVVGVYNRARSQAKMHGQRGPPRRQETGPRRPAKSTNL